RTRASARSLPRSWRRRNAASGFHAAARSAGTQPARPQEPCFAPSHRCEKPYAARHAPRPGADVLQHLTASRLRLGLAHYRLRQIADGRDNIRLTIGRRILRAVNYVMMNNAFADTVKRIGPSRLPFGFRFGR